MADPLHLHKFDKANRLLHLAPTYKIDLWNSKKTDNEISYHIGTQINPKIVLDSNMWPFDPLELIPKSQLQSGHTYYRLDYDDDSFYYDLVRKLWVNNHQPPMATNRFRQQWEYLVNEAEDQGWLETL